MIFTIQDGRALPSYKMTRLYAAVTDRPISTYMHTEESTCQRRRRGTYHKLLYIHYIIVMTELGPLYLLKCAAQHAAVLST